MFLPWKVDIHRILKESNFRITLIIEKQKKQKKTKQKKRYILSGATPLIEEAAFTSEIAARIQGKLYLIDTIGCDQGKNSKSTRTGFYIQRIHYKL